ncbi:hypothetical protein CI102_6211 [Trichoderma harzianum]|nr:hypothetical protein CI102_6211 [Trichoderma harzianum]
MVSNLKQLVEQQFPFCEVHQETVPVRVAAVCPTHTTHAICHECMAQAFYERPLRSVSRDCNDFLITFTNLPNPSRCEPIIAAFNTVDENWRRRHPCRGERECNSFAKHDGTCANPECTNFFCPRCETTNHLAASPCDTQTNAETDTLVAALVGRGHLMQCAINYMAIFFY